MKNKIVYRNKIELIILIVAFSIIYIPLFSYVVINDIIKNSPYILSNIGGLLIFLFVLLIPILIISRFKNIFDYDNNKVIYIPYFKKKKVYNFDDLEIVYQHSKTTVLCYDFIFYYNKEKLFKISDIDFKGQTKCDPVYLKKIFKGIEKRIFELEIKLKEENVDVYVYSYSIPNIKISIGINDYHYSIEIEYNSYCDKFHCSIIKKEMENEGYYKVPTVSLLENISINLDDLEKVCLSYIHKFKNLNNE